MMKSYTVFCLTAVLVMAQVSMAAVFSQLQFIKIKTPQEGQTVRPGETLNIEYEVQPIIFKQVSKGYTKSLDITFHRHVNSTTGGPQMLEVQPICSRCKISIEGVQVPETHFATYTESWTVPENLPTGPYAFDFSELVQLRRGEMSASQTVVVNVAGKDDKDDENDDDDE
ncbi:hypothetical protein BDF20DRAFT_655924 [Mycotypha africana]|uniref:uncharacterized protein n=1 Tax=Mycotypha africana TaxID=64632 RepID=UPI002300C654|nr:uncharacterized protein BDF20DRAFT_655924 [Mycotypha africana]KAI8973506.1 hypothetical protein BDF20DRAFT_655924 [Mycotypha africana]